MNARLLLSAMSAMAISLGSGLRSIGSSSKQSSAELPSALVNSRTANKSQRVMRSERGMRPRVAVHTRRNERRAKNAFKGKPL